MICPKCKTEAIENYALHKKFFYCKVCKDEVTENSGKPNHITLGQYDTLIEELNRVYGHESSLPVGNKAIRH